MLRTTIKVAPARSSRSDLRRGEIQTVSLRSDDGWKLRQWAAAHRQQWLWRASHSRLAPFTKLAKTIGAHRDGVLASTTLRITNGVLEDMNNKGQGSVIGRSVSGRRGRISRTSAIAAQGSD
jgi:transposase